MRNVVIKNTYGNVRALNVCAGGSQPEAEGKPKPICFIPPSQNCPFPPFFHVGCTPNRAFGYNFKPRPLSPFTLSHIFNFGSITLPGTPLRCFSPCQGGFPVRRTHVPLARSRVRATLAQIPVCRPGESWTRLQRTRSPASANHVSASLRFNASPVQNFGDSISGKMRVEDLDMRGGRPKGEWPWWCQKS